jgi:hypothetical protein
MATLDEFIAQETSAIEDLKPLYKLADTKIEYTSEEYDLIIKARANKLFDEQENNWKYNRELEYPSLQDCIHALLDGGDTLTDLQAARQAVKDKYPKG